MPQFLGAVRQRVPMTSAVKVDGERLYKKAHRGEIVETPVKDVEIAAIDILAFDQAAQTMRCRIACSKGTYVRQLAIDIGEAVGAGAHLRQLSRTATGDLHLAAARTLAEFEEARRRPGGRRRAHPRAREPGGGLAVHAGHRALGRAGDGGAQRRPAAGRASASRCASPTAASSSRSTARPRKATRSSCS